MTDSADQKYPCLTCANAHLMDFETNQQSPRTEVFCLSIGKLLDEGWPIRCSGYKRGSGTEGS